MDIVANLSMLFTELPLLERVRAAAAAGFSGVEIQFPYEVPALQLKEELQRCAMPLVLMNLPAGDLMQGGAGLACHPKRRQPFADALDEALSYALMVRPRMVNVLAGRLPEGVCP